ncbi:MAG: hypothetical protein NUV94_05335 [Candidatus Acetothermia bacterium]|jgi:hypothetical protein|nr:hypothetical protein [Candidatus Acetothermia bacterium]
MLLRAIGESERDRVIEDEVQKILRGARLSEGDAAFLVVYMYLQPLAKGLEKAGRPVGAAVSTALCSNRS